jgi:dihydrofolate reductase
MTAGHVFIATSLDGYIARVGGGLDWLPGMGEGAEAMPQAEDHGYDAFIAGMDGIVMGGATFRVARAFDPWPYALPLVVVSRAMTGDDVPEGLRGQVRIVRSITDARAATADLGWRHAYIDGGQVITGYLAAGAITDLVITRVPVLLGAGLPLFGALPGDVRLRHLGTTAFPSGLVQSRYAVA